jgi:hypothetical protein
MARKRGEHARKPKPQSLSFEERRAVLRDFEPGNPVWQAWLALTPEERLVRAWKRREQLIDPRAVHDARLPEL